MTSSAQHPLVIAHRGASGYRPEHSRSAYELAIDLGADAIEPDIVPSKDGVLVLRHENEISGTTDVADRPEFAARRVTKIVDGIEVTGWFTEDFTWAELATLTLRERLPAMRPNNTTFDGLEGMLRLSDLVQILDAAPRPVGLVAEIKHAAYFDSIGLPLAELFAAEMVALGWAADPRLTIESFELDVLHSIRAAGIEAPLIYLIEAQGAPADRVARDGDAASPYSQDLSDAGLAALVASGIDGISVSKKLLLRVGEDGAPAITSVVQRAHGVGLRVFTWTLRAENIFLVKGFRSGVSPEHFGDWLAEFQLIMSSGVDGVFADQPDLAALARLRR
ncbi:glycerophosphodiester phosphodiesterase family protein [Salinibacterium hongtaonis]|uniref:glycerophosphodiester phosphodiesterase n=1 Tax=Homoserinimonas hongtaonis TaxID=2079791 RepID=A0A2U1T2K8_9MICO|nr:glycerophosphodiester phosphodiesterase family protein [Salinibacterium hongtaonis]PWB98097.1 glycerophosphodiester phosphodiesterase [Salinibacterium hongtaonis]